MGLVLCEKHGTSGIILSCVHLSQSVWDYKSIYNCVKRVQSYTEDADGFSYDWIHYLCERCNKQNKNITIDEFPEDFFQPSCGKCFKELLNLEN